MVWYFIGVYIINRTVHDSHWKILHSFTLLSREISHLRVATSHPLITVKEHETAAKQANIFTQFTCLHSQGDYWLACLSVNGFPE